VSDGRYWVQVSPHRGYVASLTSGGVDLLREMLVVAPGSTSAPIYVTLRDDGAKLSGTIAGTNPAKNQSNATGGQSYFAVVCIQMDGDVARSVFQSSSSNGKFSFGNLAPGRFLVIAKRIAVQQGILQLQGLEYRNEKVMRQLISKGTAVTLEARQSAEIQVPLLPDEEN
jgi:hypothetical protein